MFLFFRLSILPFVLFLLCSCSNSPQPPSDKNREIEKVPGQREDKGKRAEAPDAAAIAKLVKQLGSSDFRAREAATKALTAIGFPALQALRKAAKGDDPEVARRATRLIESIEQGLDQLLADYRGYGLPLPPENAKLVRFGSGIGHIIDGKRMPPTYFLGFLLQPGTKDKPPLL